MLPIIRTMFCHIKLILIQISKKLIVFIFIAFLILPFLFLDHTSAEEIKTIAPAKQEAKEKGKIEATVSGYATAPPQQLSKQYFYIQDETGGIQIYDSKGEFPELFLGQKIKVTGEIKEAYKEFRLTVSFMEILPGIDALLPKEVAKIDEEIEGQLVFLKGYYQSSYSSGFYLEKDGIKTRVAITSYASDNEKVTKPKMGRGDLIQVIGIASQYDTSASINNYRLLPRFQEDIKILEKAKTEETSGETEENRTDIPLISIGEARGKEKESEVLVQGQVTVLPNIFSARYFYIQDNTSGIQVYFSKAQWPNFSLGQKVKIFGTMSEANNEKRIKISALSDIITISSEKEPGPIALKTGQIDESTEGMLVKIEGSVVSPSGNLFYLDDGSGKIKIYVKKEAKINKPKLKKGQKVQIVGIVSQYKDAYRLLPRKTEDLKTAGGNTLTLSKKKTNIDEVEENEEEEIVLDDDEENDHKKVLGAGAERPITEYWPYGLALFCLGIVGYLVNDFKNTKQPGNPGIWQKIRQAIKRRRNSGARW